MPSSRISAYKYEGTIKSRDLEADLDSVILMIQQNEMHDDIRNLSYPNSAVISDKDRILPILDAGYGWRMNEAGTEIEAVNFSSVDDFDELKNDLSSHDAGKGASLIGLQTPSALNLQQFIDTIDTMAFQNNNAVNILGGTITGITDISIQDGGTGASTAADARANLGLMIGSNVQAWSENLDEVSSISGLGIISSTNTGITVREIKGTINEIDVSNGNAASQNPSIGIADNPTLPGASYVKVPHGSTAERSTTPSDFMIRGNRS